MSNDGLYKPTKRDIASALGAAPTGTAAASGEEPPVKKKGDKAYLYAILIGFALVIAVNIGMVVVALDSFSGLETDDAYRKGIRYNDTIAASKQQAEMGWQVNYFFEPLRQSTEGREGEIRVVFADKDEQSLGDLDVEVIFSRPVQQGLDQKLTLKHKKDGIYTGMAKLPKAGQWDLRILAWQGEKAFQEIHRIQIP